jgi:hypothetical protein
LLQTKRQEPADLGSDKGGWYSPQRPTSRPAISFSDEELDLLYALASALPPSVRGDFLTIVGSKFAGFPRQARGVGLLHRVAAEVQRAHIVSPVAIGVEKHGPST